MHLIAERVDIRGNSRHLLGRSNDGSDVLLQLRQDVVRLGIGLGVLLLVGNQRGSEGLTDNILAELGTLTSSQDSDGSVQGVLLGLLVVGEEVDDLGLHGGDGAVADGSRGVLFQNVEGIQLLDDFLAVEVLGLVVSVLGINGGHGVNELVVVLELLDSIQLLLVLLDQSLSFGGENLVKALQVVGDLLLVVVESLGGDRTDLSVHGGAEQHETSRHLHLSINHGDLRV